MSTWKASLCLVVLLAVPIQAAVTTSEYAALVQAFQQLRTNAVYPVHTFDDITSTFGPRIRASTDAYDWHRGIDITGNIGDDIIAPLDGTFWRRTTYSSGGETVILRHAFPEPVTLNGYDFDYFYTLYLHLYDDGIGGNTNSTDDIITNWIEQVTVVTARQVIASLGDSGDTVSPHLHFEIRAGTRLSHEYQLENSDTNGGTTFNYEFDPHIHPMLLFEPYELSTVGTNSYTNFSLLGSTVMADSNILLRILSSTDDMPLMNRFEVSLTTTDGSFVASHTLDFNLRSGFDTTSNAALDEVDFSQPYIEPLPFGYSPTNYETGLVIPSDWLGTNGIYGGDDFLLALHFQDIWGEPSDIILPVPTLRSVLDQTLPQDGIVSLEWESVPGQGYGLQASTNLAAWAELPGLVYTAGISQISIDTQVPATNDEFFLRAITR